MFDLSMRCNYKREVSPGRWLIDLEFDVNAPPADGRWDRSTASTAVFRFATHDPDLAGSIKPGDTFQLGLKVAEPACQA